MKIQRHHLLLLFFSLLVALAAGNLIAEEEAASATTASAYSEDAAVPTTSSYSEDTAAAATSSYFEDAEDAAAWDFLEESEDAAALPPLNFLDEAEQGELQVEQQEQRMTQRASSVCRDNGDCDRDEFCFDNRCISDRRGGVRNICFDNGDCGRDERCFDNRCIFSDGRGRGRGGGVRVNNVCSDRLDCDRDERCFDNICIFVGNDRVRGFNNNGRGRVGDFCVATRECQSGLGCKGRVCKVVGAGVRGFTNRYNNVGVRNFNDDYYSDDFGVRNFNNGVDVLIATNGRGSVGDFCVATRECRSGLGCKGRRCKDVGAGVRGFTNNGGIYYDDFGNVGVRNFNDRGGFIYSGNGVLIATNNDVCASIRDCPDGYRCRDNRCFLDDGVRGSNVFIRNRFNGLNAYDYYKEVPTEDGNV